MRKQIQLVKYLEAVLFVTIERMFMAGVVGGMCNE